MSEFKKGARSSDSREAYLVGLREACARVGVSERTWYRDPTVLPPHLPRRKLPSGALAPYQFAVADIQEHVDRLREEANARWQQR